MTTRACGAPQAIWHGDGSPGVPILTCVRPAGHESAEHYAPAPDGVHAYIWQQPGHLYPGDKITTISAEGVDRPQPTCHVEIT